MINTFLKLSIIIFILYLLHQNWDDVVVFCRQYVEWVKDILDMGLDYMESRR
ncbi:hypothetical protein [Vibrio barjaei]|uniref:hypothetical protein n=1 Tax=Vibrio barjaei TaxID=1676683 RepID=UPI00228345EF|nr:hypothetical protein [Vibrio barjaei]MCY9873869.1 hypothetical protein [Vibrio barjaei]